MKTQSGFVLVNALVLVAAMAAAAVFVLGRAETGRTQLAASQNAVQLGAYLDAFESQAMVVLTRDSIGVDHPSDVWARAATSFALDRGRVSGEITDAAGLFNINWLANPSDTPAQAAFGQLARDIGLGQDVTDRLVAALAITPDASDRYAQLDPPLRAKGGALNFERQLETIATLSAQERAKLAPFVAVLPADSQLNINTAPVGLITAFFPAAARANVARLLGARDVAPLRSIDAFLDDAEIAFGQSFGEDFDRSRFAVGSPWFRVTIRGELGARRATRMLLLERRGQARRPLVRWRETQFR